jgi:hypothetical protein
VSLISRKRKKDDVRLDNPPQSSQQLIIKRDEEAWQSREHQNETKRDKTRVWMDRLHDFDSGHLKAFRKSRDGDIFNLFLKSLVQYSHE